MTNEEFIQKCEELFGPKRKVWRKGFKELTGCSAATVSRYASGICDVPRWAVVLLTAVDRLDDTENFLLEVSQK